MTENSKTLSYETIRKARAYLDQINKVPVSDTQLAALSGFDRTRVKRQTRDIEPLGLWKNAPLKPLGKCLQALLAAAKATSPADQRNQAQAEKLRLETSILAGNHIPMSEHEERFARTMKAIKDRVRANRDLTNDTKRDLLDLIKLTIGQVDDEYTANHPK